MKKIFLMLSLLIAIHMKTKAQQEKQLLVINYVTASVEDNRFAASTNSPYNNGPDKNHDFYQRKSKNARIVGWSTLGGGILLSGIGLLMANGDYATNNGGSTTAGVLTVAGAALGIVSIPFMIMASTYKHKAKLMLSNQKTGFGVPSNVSKGITGITLSIPISK